MNETELESMVVRLLGDGSSYAQMMNTAQETTRQATQVIQQQATQIEGIKNSITGFASTAVSALAALGAAGFLKKSLDMFSETETATIKLSAAIKANGANVADTIAAYKEFAKQLKVTTGASSDETLGLLKKAEAFGLTGKAAMVTVENAHRLAAGADVDAESAIRITAALQQGEVRRAQAMSRLVPALRGVRDETEFLTKVQLLMNIGQEQQVALMNSTEGVFRRFHGSLKMVTKQFGEYVAEAIVPVVKWVTQLIEKYGKLDEGTKRIVVAVAIFAAGILSILPVLGSISAIATPFIALFVKGFGIVAAVISLILSPLLIFKGVLLAIGGAIALVFNPLTYVVLLAGAAIVGLIRRMGGLQATWDAIKAWGLSAWERIKTYAGQAWDYITTKALEFYEWFKPIADAAASFAIALWRKISEVATGVWDWIKARALDAGNYLRRVWQDMLGDVTFNWNETQDVIQRVILFAEFGLNNFRPIAEAVWTAFALKAIQAIRQVAGAMEELSTFQRILLAALTSGASEAAFAGMRAVSAALAPLEEVLANDLRVMANQLGQSFEEFVIQRRREFAQIRSTAENPATNPLQPILDTAREINKEVGKLEAVLFRSAESVHRVRDYFNRLETPRVSFVSGGSAAPAGQRSVSSEQPVPVVQTGGGGSAGNDQTQQAIRDFVRRIAVATEQVAARPQVNVVGLSLT